MAKKFCYFVNKCPCSICALLTAITTISRLMTSAGRRSIASRRVSSQALATTGSLLSMEERMPRKNVFVNELDFASMVDGDTGNGGPGIMAMVGPVWGMIIGGDRCRGGETT